MQAWSSTMSLTSILNLADAHRFTQTPSPAAIDALCAAIERTVASGQMNASTYSKAIV
jgi:hypothetical protein